jgi:hypothetical protein
LECGCSRATDRQSRTFPEHGQIQAIAEVQALLDDHLAGGKHSAADVVAKAQAVLSEPELLWAMFDAGYFPPNTPQD